MRLIGKPKRSLGLNEPLRHENHPHPKTRREFISQGFVAGGAAVVGGSIFSMFANPRAAYAALSPDIEALKATCGIATTGAGKIPFICFDLSGGANIVGSNVLIGGQGGQMDFLSAAGYSKLGLPGDMVPNAPNAQSSTNNFINSSLGLAFHSDSAFLRGMLQKVSPATAANINGAVIAASSQNDTANNPHNPMYGIHKAGADGALLTLIGSVSSDSGGSSMAPLSMIDPKFRPTKVDRTSDVTGLVDTGKLVGLLAQDDAVSVMESIERISKKRIDKVQTKLSNDAVVKQLVQCGYVKSADLAYRYGNPSTLNPELDTSLVGPSGVFTRADFDSDSEFRKSAAVMKLVVNGFAGAGTIQMGGFDYHTGDRATGEARDLRAGQCLGACLEYAARVGVPLMIYVFSDGSLASNGMIDSSVAGRGKGQWTGDNSSTAATFFLIYNPKGRPQLFTGDATPAARHQQIGYFRPDASVETSSSPAANAVNLLVETVVLNYMALHGQQGQFANLFPNTGLGSASLRDSITAFNPIVNGTIS